MRNNILLLSLATVLVSSLFQTVKAQTPVYTGGQIRLAAARSFGTSNLWRDDAISFTTPVRVIVPQQMPIDQGNAGNAPVAAVIYYVSNGHADSIWYKGVADVTHPYSPANGAEIIKANVAVYNASTSGVVPGDTLTVTFLKLRANMGDNSDPENRLYVSLDINPVQSATTRWSINGSNEVLPAGVTAVTNALQIPTGASAGAVLVSDASGNAAWQQPNPIASAFSITGVNQDTVKLASKNLVLGENAYINGMLKIGMHSMYLASSQTVSGTVNSLYTDNAALLINSADNNGNALATYNNTIINNGGGQVGIGTATPASGSVLTVVGGINTDNLTATNITVPANGNLTFLGNGTLIVGPNGNFQLQATNGTFTPGANYVMTTTRAQDGFAQWTDISTLFPPNYWNSNGNGTIETFSNNSNVIIQGNTTTNTLKVSQNANTPSTTQVLANDGSNNAVWEDINSITYWTPNSTNGGIGYNGGPNGNAVTVPSTFYVGGDFHLGPSKSGNGQDNIALQVYDNQLTLNYGNGYGGNVNVSSNMSLGLGYDLTVQGATVTDHLTVSPSTKSAATQTQVLTNDGNNNAVWQEISTVNTPLWSTNYASTTPNGGIGNTNSGDGNVTVAGRLYVNGTDLVLGGANLIGGSDGRNVYTGGGGGQRALVHGSNEELWLNFDNDFAYVEVGSPMNVEGGVGINIQPNTAPIAQLEVQGGLVVRNQQYANVGYIPNAINVMRFNSSSSVVNTVLNLANSYNGNSSNLGVTNTLAIDFRTATAGGIEADPPIGRIKVATAYLEPSISFEILGTPYLVLDQNTGTTISTNTTIQGNTTTNSLTVLQTGSATQTQVLTNDGSNNAVWKDVSSFNQWASSGADITFDGVNNSNAGGKVVINYNAYTANPSSITGSDALDVYGITNFYGNVAISGNTYIKNELHLGENDGNNGTGPVSPKRAMIHGSFTNPQGTALNDALIINTGGDYTGGVAVGSDFAIEGNTYLNKNLSVGGSIGAEKVCVNASGTWCDYVFDKHYKLNTLKEVEDYIAKNHHLPGVPAAEVVEKEGIQVADMFKAQMEKIEELTLHLIQQQKEIEALKKKLK